MNRIPSSHRARRSLAAAAAMLCFAPAFAAGPPAADPLAAAKATYARERAACLSGESYEDRETCLKEAGAALAEARRKDASSPDESAATLAANAMRRCQAVPAADRYACEQMAQGRGTVSGSVEGGGVLKEYREVVPAQ
ncbi:MAG: hypothetical protein KDG44_08230 [Burkholderiaceae bacterium]|nr:hypothetical protein [Burkholderiaceae bacterium]